MRYASIRMTWMKRPSVKKMRRIYDSAEAVLVFLGSPSVSRQAMVQAIVLGTPLTRTVQTEAIMQSIRHDWKIHDLAIILGTIRRGPGHRRRPRGASLKQMLADVPTHRTNAQGSCNIGQDCKELGIMNVHGALYSPTSRCLNLLGALSGRESG
jgi:hypothetical protein